MHHKPAWETTDLPYIARLGLLVVCSILLIVMIVSGFFILGSNYSLQDGTITQTQFIQTALICTSLIVVGVAALYFLFPLTRNVGDFTPSYGMVLPTELQAPFEVYFERYLWGRSLRGKGIVQFIPEGLRIEGFLEPSIWFQLGIILVVTLVPLVVFGIGLGIIPALLLAYYLGRKPTVVSLPYALLSAPQLKGRTLRLNNEQVPKKIAFAVARSDGERLYNEIAHRYPNLILTQS